MFVICTTFRTSVVPTARCGQPRSSTCAAGGSAGSGRDGGCRWRQRHPSAGSPRATRCSVPRRAAAAAAAQPGSRRAQPATHSAPAAISTGGAGQSAGRARAPGTHDTRGRPDRGSHVGVSWLHTAHERSAGLRAVRGAVPSPPASPRVGRAERHRLELPPRSLFVFPARHGSVVAVLQSVVVAVQLYWTEPPAA